MRDFLSRAWPPLLAAPDTRHPCLIRNLMAVESLTTTERYQPGGLSAERPPASGKIGYLTADEFVFVVWENWGHSSARPSAAMRAGTSALALASPPLLWSAWSGWESACTTAERSR